MHYFRRQDVVDHITNEHEAQATESIYEDCAPPPRPKYKLMLGVGRPSDASPIE